jgi:Protein of unknown function (DUF4242)
MMTLRASTLVVAAVLALGGCGQDDKAQSDTTPAVAEAPPEPATPPPAEEAPPPAADPAAPAEPAAASGEKKLFIDVHEFGPGKVTAAAVAEAHQKDLATQDKHGVNFKTYWVDEKNGRVYCLSEAPNADAPSAAHKEAHGGVPAKVYAVTEPDAELAAEPSGAKGKKLFLDVHNVGPGKITAAAVKEVHAKDLATQGKFGVSFLNYWVDEETGTVFCLSEAKNAKAPNKTHKKAHGAVANEVFEVKMGH